MARTHFYFSTTSATGWTYSSSDFEFLAAGLHLKATKTSSVAMSPAQSASGWGRIYRVDVTVREERDVDSLYTHRFLVSFDGGATFKGPLANGRLQTMDSGGFTAKQLADWRAWPPAADVSSVRVAVTASRTIPAGDEAEGYVVTLGFVHGDDVEIVDPEPDEYDALPYGDTAGHYLGPEPDFPISCDFVQPRNEFFSLSGHSQGTRKTDFVRRVYDLSWEGRDATEIAAMEAFFDSHHDASFLWTPPGFVEPRAFVCSEYSRDHAFVGSGGARVGGFRARWIEVPIPAYDYRFNPDGYAIAGASSSRVYSASQAVVSGEMWWIPWLVPDGGVVLEEVKIKCATGGSMSFGSYGAVYSSVEEGNPSPHALLGAFGDVSGSPPPHFLLTSSGVKTVSNLAIELPGGEVVWFAFFSIGAGGPAYLLTRDDQGAWPIFGYAYPDGQDSSLVGLRETGVSLSDPVFDSEVEGYGGASPSPLGGSPLIAFKYSPRNA